MKIECNKKQAVRVLVKAGVDQKEAEKIAQAIVNQTEISEDELSALIKNYGNSQEFSVAAAKTFIAELSPVNLTGAFEASFLSGQRPTAQRSVVRRYKRPIMGAIAAVSLALLGFVGFMAISAHREAKKAEAAVATPPATPAPAETPATTPAAPAEAAPPSGKSCSDGCVPPIVAPDDVMMCLTGCIATAESDNSKLKKQLEKKDQKLATAKAEYEKALKAKDDEIAAAKAEATAKVEAKKAEAARELAAKDAEAKKALAEKSAELKRQAEAAKAEAAKVATEQAKAKAEAEAKARVPTCAAAIEACKASPISQAMKRQGRSDAWIAEQCERSARFKQAAHQCQ